MPELTEAHKRRLGKTLWGNDGLAFEDDDPPSPDSEAVKALAAELSTEPPVAVDLVDDHLGLYGWPADGVRAKIAAEGGSIRFGWRLHEWPGILLTANFHCVWVNPEGKLIDITPPAASGYVSLFIPDPTYPEDFDFAQRPHTAYKVLHRSPDWSADVAERIAALKPGQRGYEERRAQKAGVPLEQWMLRKFPVDLLPPLIDAFIQQCRDYDARLPGLPDLLRFLPPVPEHAAEPAPAADGAPGEVAEDAAADDVEGGDLEDEHAFEDEDEDDADPDPVEFETAVARETLFDWNMLRDGPRDAIMRVLRNKPPQRNA